MFDTRKHPKADATMIYNFSWDFYISDRAVGGTSID